MTQWDDSYLYDPFLLISERDERLFLNDQIVVGSDSGQVNGFVGCMRALTINGNLLDLHGHAMHEPGFLTFPGCIGQCDRSPCQNNGICFEYWDNFQCDCRESAFAGEICTEGQYELNFSIALQRYFILLDRSFYNGLVF